MFEIFNDNDLRWLLDVSVLPEDYDTEYLISVFDKILFEYEELKGDKFYSNFLRKSDFAAKDAAKLVVLRGCYTLMLVGAEDSALDLLKQIKVKADTSEAVDRQMKLLTQRLQVKAMKEAGKTKEKQSFGAYCASIKNQLPNSDPRNGTVAECIGYENIIKQLNTK